MEWLVHLKLHNGRATFLVTYVCQVLVMHSQIRSSITTQGIEWCSVINEQIPQDFAAAQDTFCPHPTHTVYTLLFFFIPGFKVHIDSSRGGFNCSEIEATDIISTFRFAPLFFYSFLHPRPFVTLSELSWRMTIGGTRPSSSGFTFVLCVRGASCEQLRFLDLHPWYRSSRPFQAYKDGPSQYRRVKIFMWYWRA